MTTTVIYHAGCADGFCAAWLCRKKFPEATFIPASYGDDPPAVDGLVLIVDFSYPREVLVGLQEQCDRVVVLDHHKTAQEDLAELVGDNGKLLVRFDMDKSGARMVWDFLGFDQGQRHWLVDYTEDRDLWRHALPRTKEINAALRSRPMDFEEWDRLALMGTDPLIIEGEAILRYKEQLVNQHVRFARWAMIGGHRVPAVNCSAGDLQSELAGLLSTEQPFAAVWVDQGDGTQLWSLRSREAGEDVGAIAKSLGGGGHRNASGFRCEAGTIAIGERVT